MTEERNSILIKIQLLLHGSPICLRYLKQNAQWSNKNSGRTFLKKFWKNHWQQGLIGNVSSTERTCHFTAETSSQTTWQFKFQNEIQSRSSSWNGNHKEKLTVLSSNSFKKNDNRAFRSFLNISPPSFWSWSVWYCLHSFPFISGCCIVHSRPLWSCSTANRYFNHLNRVATDWQNKFPWLFFWHQVIFPWSKE